jgi:hypothetical protein
LVVVAVASANVLRMAQVAPPPPADSPAVVPDPVSRQEHRFDALRSNLRSRGLKGALGYVSSRSRSRWTEESHEGEIYYRTQFALAPLVLDPEPANYDWAVANLPSAGATIQTPAGWSIAQDFGDGVFLLHKGTR